MDNRNTEYRLKLRWLKSSFVTPGVFVIAFLLIFGIFLFSIYDNLKTEQTKDIQILAERVSKNIELKLKGNLDYLKLIALERSDGNITEQSFQSNVTNYLKDHPEFINITWIDSNFVIKTVSPLVGNSHIIGLHIELPEPKRASHLARLKKECIYTKPFEAIQSNSSFEVWVPVFKKDKFVGLFAGVYSCTHILELSIPVDRQYKSFISMVDENGVRVAEYPKPNLGIKGISFHAPLVSLGNGMYVDVEMIKNQPFGLLTRILILLTIALVLSIAYSLWKIKLEIQFRRRIQDSLKRNEIELKRQNVEYLSLNEELTESNNRIQKINQDLLQSKIRAEESETLLRLSTELGNVAVWEYNFIENSMSRSPNHDILYGLEWQTKWDINTFLNATHPEDREYSNNTIQNSVSKDGPNQYSFDFRVIYPDQTIHWLAVTGTVVKRNDLGIGTVVRGCLIDITYRKNYEIELFEKNEELKIAKDKAEESDRLKTAFLQNMSHEIRTPMNAIMGFSDILINQFNNKEKFEKYSKIIQQRCRDLLDIINDILDISKIESGQLPINWEECNLDELFLELNMFFKEYQNRQNKQHLKFNILAFKGFQKIIIIDKVKLKQILINLITNAFKFTEEGIIEVGCKTDSKNKILFYVSDTGIGIPIKKQKVIFERFIQLNQNPYKNIGGTGLGLSIVKGLVNILGGEIFVESSLNKGSTFSFTVEYKEP
jgi:signal transduction histidine kinase